MGRTELVCSVPGLEVAGQGWEECLCQEPHSLPVSKGN